MIDAAIAPGGRPQTTNMPFLKNSLRGVVFLGTPHSGSTLANLSHAFPRLYRPSVTIDYLRKNNASIDVMGRWFRKYADQNRELHIHAHREMKKLAVMRFLRFYVVEPSSADPGIPHAKVFNTAEKDHITICKCEWPW